MARSENPTAAGGPRDDDPARDEAAVFWDELYRDRSSWGGPPNPLLVETARTLSPGAAPDLGCGGGGDTIWLARHGWQVTAVDVSAVDRVRELARELGLAHRVRTQRHDLSRSFPSDTYDLVSAVYLHTPFALPRSSVLRVAARALRPGGLLLIVDHGSTAPWSWNQGPDTHHTTPAGIAAELDLDPDHWLVVRADATRRRATGPDAETAVVTDHVVTLRRTGGRAPHTPRERSTQ